MKKDKPFGSTGPWKLLVLSLVGAAGCGAAPTDASGVIDQSSSEVLVCSEREIDRDERGYVVLDREVYIPSDLNRLLEENADFAAAAGVASVTDCAGARQTMRVYSEYRERHPDFDNEPMTEPFAPPDPRGETPFRLPPVEGAVPLPDLNVDKIFQGVESAHTSIVRTDWLYHRPGGPAGLTPCSGTLIARQWIMTANHCVPPEARVIPANAKDRRVPPGATATMFIYREFPTGVVRTVYTNPVDATKSAMQVKVYGFPGWKTGTDKVRDFGRDFALIYIPTEYADTLFPNDLGSLAINAGTVPVGRAEELWGWGADTNSPNPATRALRTGTTPTAITAVNTNWLSATATNSNSRLCSGDSGGPALRTFDDVSIVDGVAASVSFNVEFFRCATAGDVMQWASVNDKVTWIGAVLSKWETPNFACQRFRSGSNAYAQCWKTPCDTSADCLRPGQVCQGVTAGRRGFCAIP